MLRVLIPSMLLAVAAISVHGPGEQDSSLRVNVELVQLSVSVLDKHGIPVQGLRKEQFAVYEDKVMQDISLFKQEDVPLSVALVVDTSGSMSDKLHSVHSAAITFVRESNLEDETSIVTFGNSVRLARQFTGNTHELTQALSGIVANGNTALYDAVILAAEYLKEESSHEKKALLIISDGEDNDSKNKLKAALSAIEESKIIVYSIGLVSSDSGDIDYGMMADEGKNALKRLAEASGGLAFFPKGVHEVQQVCSKIARDLRNQYTIGYRPTNEKLDGAWRRTLVHVTAPGAGRGFKVHARQGYYAPVARDAAVAAPLVKHNGP